MMVVYCIQPFDDFTHYISQVDGRIVLVKEYRQAVKFISKEDAAEAINYLPGKISDFRVVSRLLTRGCSK